MAERHNIIRRAHSLGLWLGGAPIVIALIIFIGNLVNWDFHRSGDLPGIILLILLGGVLYASCVGIGWIIAKAKTKHSN